ncbi:pentapeptide repeat-containing protein [Amycolatopsis sp. lyj-109]|uniref:pentapeptide repeat-containing protein n=1 Tax=Amycolatopsis sp. lyj-109 TaxID=2789287 RepID=UPI00397D41DA
MSDDVRERPRVSGTVVAQFVTQLPLLKLYVPIWISCEFVWTLLGSALVLLADIARVTSTRWKRRHAVVGLIAVSGALVAIQLVLTAVEQPWWPSLGGILDWLGNWYLVLIAAWLACGAYMLHRRGKRSATTPPVPVRWVEGPDQLSVVARPAATRAPSELALQSRWNWTAITSVITAFTAIGALLFTSLSLKATEQGQVTDRYTKAIDQIGTTGNDHLETRLGGVYALERLAHDSPRDQPTIIEVLSAFIRSNAPHITSPPLRGGTCSSPAAITLDVQAALTVLGRRDTSQDSGTSIDLHQVCMAGANLTGANLVGADLSDARLTKVGLFRANLSGAELSGTYLDNAYLADAELTNAHLAVADLTRADLFKADLTNAQLDNALLTEAQLSKANLAGADLFNADLTYARFENTNLTGTNFRSAKLAGADFVGADLTNAEHDASTITKDAWKSPETIGAWW